MSISKDRGFCGQGRFNIINHLGDGGMGVVYEVEDTELNKRVALKTLINKDAESLFRLKKEFRSLQNIRHRNLISFGELLEYNGTWFFTMELVDGIDVISYIRDPFSLNKSDGKNDWDTVVVPPVISDETSKNERAKDSTKIKSPYPIFEEQRVRDVFIQLSKGLMALHDAGKLHRDIKSNNIMVDKTGRVILMDLGLVTSVEKDKNSAARFYPIGTSEFMSPEQAGSKPLTPASDWYSIGVVLFHALTGRLPFEGSFASVVIAKQTQPAPDPIEYNPAVPLELNRLCVDLLKIDPQLRINGNEIIKRLEGSSKKEQFPGISTDTQLFVGRETEKRALLDAFHNVLEGNPLSVLLYGSSGLGKSELLKNVLEEIQGDYPKTIILGGRCYENESVSFKAFDPIIDSLSTVLRKLPKDDASFIVPRNSHLLIKVFPVLMRVEAMNLSKKHRLLVTDPQMIRSLAFQALRELFIRLSERYNIIIVIDDFQWADEDSLRLMRSLLQPPDAPQFLFIASKRVSNDKIESENELAESVKAFPGVVKTVHVGPFSNEESLLLAQQLQNSIKGRKEDNSIDLMEIANQSEGHPLFIQEMIRHANLKDNHLPQMSRQLLDEALWSRVNLLQSDLQNIIRLLSVSGTPISPILISETVNIDPNTILDKITELKMMNFVKTSGKSSKIKVELFHDRIKESVYERLTKESKKDLHLKLANSFMSYKNIQPELMARHLEAAGEYGKTVKYLLQAGRQAEDALAFERASRFYRKAINYWEYYSDTIDKNRLKHVWIRLGEALANSGRGQEAAHAYLEAISFSSDIDETIDFKRLAARHLLLSGHVSAGMNLIEQIAEAIGVKLPKSAFGSMISFLFRRILIRLRGLNFKERNESQISHRELVKVDLYYSMAIGMAIADIIKGADFSTRWVHAALNAGEPQRILSALTVEANYIAASGKVNSSYQQKLLKRAHEIMRTNSNLVVKGYIDGSYAYGTFMEGKWNESLHHATKALEIFSKSASSSWEKGQMHYVIIWSLFYLGHIEEMNIKTKIWVTDAMERGDLLAASGMVLGLSNLAYIIQDGPEVARQVADDMINRWTGKGFRLHHYYHLLSDINIDLYSGNGNSALQKISGKWKSLKKSLLLLIPAVFNESLHLKARSILSSIGNESNPNNKLLKRAYKDAKILSKRGLPWTNALAELIFSTVHNLRGEDERTVKYLKSAINTLESSEMAFHSSVAKFQLGNIVQGDEGDEYRTSAMKYFESQNITDIEGISRMLLPGFVIK